MRWAKAGLCILMMTGLLLLSGCAGMGSRAQLRTAGDAYNTTMSVLTECRAAGLISDEDAETIEQARVVARVALDSWRAAVDRGEGAAGAAARFYGALVVLVEARVAAEAGTVKGGDTDGLD